MKNFRKPSVIESENIPGRDLSECSLPPPYLEEIKNPMWLNNKLKVTRGLGRGLCCFLKTYYNYFQSNIFNIYLINIV